jgi:ubiquitin-conjugating enzyme E2 R
MAGESAAIRWSPAQRVESVLLSVLSLLDDANIGSPANVDAMKTLRDRPEEYKERVRKDLEACQQDIPPGFVMPTTDAYNTKKEENFELMDDWADSDAEFDFSGSDSDMDDEDMEVDDNASGSAEDEDDDEEDEEEEAEDKPKETKAT